MLCHPSFSYRWYGCAEGNTIYVTHHLGIVRAVHTRPHSVTHDRRGRFLPRCAPQLNRQLRLQAFCAPFDLPAGRHFTADPNRVATNASKITSQLHALLKKSDRSFSYGINYLGLNPATTAVL